MKNRLIRRTSSVAVAVGALALAACGGGGGSSSAGGSTDLTVPDKKEGTLTMVTKFADPQYAPYFEKVVSDYEAANPDVDIKLEQVGDQPYKDKIRVLSAANDLPDIYFSWAGDFANKFIRAGLAADLTSVIGPDTKVGSTLAPAALDAFEYQGKNYGLPIDLDGKFLAYSGAAFDKAGISNEPGTLEELLTDCDKLSSAGYTPIAFGNQFGWPAIHYITQLNAYNVPAETLDKDYDPKGGEFTDPGYVTALEQFQQILDRCANPDANGLAHEAAQANFIGGKAAMQYIESLEFQVLTAAGGAPEDIASDWNFFRLPPAADAAGDTKALTGAPDGFLINAHSENAGLAADFLTFFAQQDNAQEMVKDLGWLSPVEGSADAKGSYPQLGETLKDMGQASRFAIWLDTVANADVASAYLSGVEGLVNGDNTPEQVMESVKKAAAAARERA
jgi:raffinose/stachyose/melibiose transport system substrate-binding protein